MRRFYKKAVSMLSQNRLYASTSFYGVGAFCNKDFNPNEPAMEIEANYTLSSFDENEFPYHNELNEFFINSLEANKTNIVEVNELKFMINLNYLRYYKTDVDRFWKIYFENLPKHKDFLPFWDNQDKEILRKLINDPGVEQDLFYINRTSLLYLTEDVKKVLKKIDPNMPQLLLSDNKFIESFNILSSRTLPITAKGWKILHKKTSQIEELDIFNTGFILVPGADAINYERIKVDHPDMKDSQVKYENGKVVLKAGRHYKKGEEFTINYDIYATVYNIFKKYGFVPIDAIYNNMIWRNNYIDLSNAPKPGKLVCVALSACIGDPDNNVFEVPKYTNKFDIAHLNVERLRYWKGPPFTETKMIEIYQSIIKNEHSNLTEGLALSGLAHSFYGYLLYSSNFKIDFDTLVSMYNQNEENVPVPKILESSFSGKFKMKIDKDTHDMKLKFREILKYVLINNHIVALNTREAQNAMNRTLDNLIENLKNEIIDQVS